MHPKVHARSRGHRIRLAAGALALTLVSAGCTMPQSIGTGAAPADEPAPEPVVATSESTSVPDPAEAPPATGEGETPAESFLAWFDASRAPDVDTSVACGYMADELVERMLAELAANGWASIGDCAAMVTATAELYSAFGVEPEVRVETRSQTAKRAELWVVYPGGDCGIVVLRPEGARWIMTEQTEERC